MLAHAWMMFHNMAFWLMVLFWGLIVGGIVICLISFLRSPHSPTDPVAEEEELSQQKTSSRL